MDEPYASMLKEFKETLKERAVELLLFKPRGMDAVTFLRSITDAFGEVLDDAAKHLVKSRFLN